MLRVQTLTGHNTHDWPQHTYPISCHAEPDFLLRHNVFLGLLLQVILAHARVARALCGCPDKPAMVNMDPSILTSQQMTHDTQVGLTHMHSPWREYHACCCDSGSFVRTLTATLLRQDDYHWHDQLSQP